jgi:hypothetical protein
MESYSLADSAFSLVMAYSSNSAMAIHHNLFDRDLPKNGLLNFDNTQVVKVDYNSL